MSDSGVFASELAFDGDNRAVRPPKAREHHGEPDQSGHRDPSHDGNGDNKAVHVLEHVFLGCRSSLARLVRGGLGLVALARKPLVELRLVEALAHVLVVARGDRGEADEAERDPNDGDDGGSDV